MIKRLDVLKGVGKFSTLNPSKGTEGDFADFNIIYAKNACGKSTLCDVFRSASVGDPAYVIGRRRIGYPETQEIIFTSDNGKTVRLQNLEWQGRENCPKIHVFDDRFIADNVIIGHHVSVDQRRNLYGLVIGDQGLALKSAVEAGEERLTTATGLFNTARGALLPLIPEHYTIPSFKSLQQIDDIDDQIRAATKDLKSSEQTKSKADAIKARKSLVSLPIAKVPEKYYSVLESTLKSAALNAQQKILEHLALTSEGLSISWVKQGHEAKTGDACPHCGQDMRGLEILDAYNSYFSGALQEYEKNREELEAIVEKSFGESARNRLRQTFESHKTEQGWWKDAAGHEFDLPEIDSQNSVDDDSVNKKLSQEEIILIMEDTHRVLQDSLDRKKANPGSTVHLTESEETALAKWGRITQSLQVYNDQMDRINSDLEGYKLTAQSINLIPLQTKLAHLEIRKKRYDQSVVHAFEKYDAAEEEKKKAQEAKRIANENLREYSNEVLERYGARINELLMLFNVEFKVVSRGVDFRGMQPSGTLALELHGAPISSTPESALDPSQISLANTLSGGDRSALALAFFLARVESEPMIGEELVVFDDPYSHQDRSRQQVAIEQIHRIADIAQQCFVLSHDLEFAQTVAKKPGTQPKTFELQPLTNPATLAANALPLKPSQAYEEDYNLLSDYLENQGGHLQHLREIAVTLRVILEEYLRYKFPRSWEENDWLGDMIRKIREAQADDPLVHSQSLVDELSNINTYSKRFHHGSSGEQAAKPDARELSTYVARTLKVIHAE